MADMSPIDKLPEIDRFYHTFGRIFAEWSGVEYRLFLFFWKAIALEDPNAAAEIFFSGRSFQSRTDMLSASLVHSKMQAEWRELVEAAIDKATSYSAFRNKLAHGMLHPNALDDDGNPTEWRIKESSSWQSPEGISFEELTIAAKNIAELERIMMQAFHNLCHTSEPPRECLLQFARLPNEATSSQLSQKQLGRLRQLEARHK